MKILHTSDWHIGNTLHERRRYDEFAAFFDWLQGCITKNQIDVLLVAGDIFDSGTPSNRALSMYYSFLRKVADSCCRHVIITAGNHDSPSLLTAPGDLLRALDIHIIGSATEQRDREVIVLEDPDGRAGLIVCAVPYLRDRDVRTALPGESTDEKQIKLIDGIRSHYQEVACQAEEIKRMLNREVPIIATGHLFTTGGKTGDGVRDLYIGNLGQVHADIFPRSIQYLALGHLHVPQQVGGSPYRRYSGSPLPMGFNEAGQRKEVCIIETDASGALSVTPTPVPAFVRMERISGDKRSISNRLAELSGTSQPVLLEITITDSSPTGSIHEEIQRWSSPRLEVLLIRTTHSSLGIHQPQKPLESLQDLSETEVFCRCLDAHSIPQNDRQELIDAYAEILSAIYHKDTNAR